MPHSSATARTPGSAAKLLLSLAAGLVAACSESPSPRPSVVLIVIDTLRADAISDPDGIYDTPAIDALAADGVLFERALAHAPMTLPSHTALFASRPPIETGVLNNGQVVPQELPLLAEWLGKYGYACRAVTSLGTLASQIRDEPGLARGFEDYDRDYTFLDTADGAFPRIESSLEARDRTKPLFLFAHFSDPHEPYNAHTEEPRRVLLRIDGVEVAHLPSDAFELWEDSIPLAPGSHQIELIADHKFKLRSFRAMDGRARDGKQALEVDWKNNPKPPSFRKLGTLVRNGGNDGTQAADVDLRIWVNDSPRREEVRRRYALEVAFVDRYVGRVLERLKAEGLYDDALILFTSDHGEALGKHRGFGHVQNLTEELIAVPLIVKLPRTARDKYELDPDRLVRHVDVVPTILDLLGLPPLPGQTGKSLFQDDEGPIVHLSQTHKPEAKKDKLSLSDERFKMIYTADDGSFRMFDLVADPDELEDIYASAAGERPEWTEQLKALATVALQKTRDGESTDASVRDQLKALGYGE